MLILKIVILTFWNGTLNQCLICHNKTEKYPSICGGCLSLLSHPEFSCWQCGIELKNEQKLCGGCISKPPVFSQTFSVCEYHAPVDQWVMALKFGQKILYSKLFAELMLPIINIIDEKHVLMPVPLHKTRLRKRGYNQAYEIAKELAKLTNREIDTTLKRHKNTEMQAQLKFKQRAKNVKNAFALNQELTHKHIVLIDDVMTTGNTLQECAKTLIKAGAKDVKVMVFARKSPS